MRAWFDAIRRGALIVFRHEVVHELRSPTENEIALTLTLFHRNGRGNFFAVRGLVTGQRRILKEHTKNTQLGKSIAIPLLFAS